MNNATLMKISDGINDGTDDIPGFFLRVDLLLHDFLVQLAARKIFQNQVDVFLVPIIIIELDDIRMLNVFHYVDFSFQ
jgi:hypothetical protein